MAKRRRKVTERRGVSYARFFDLLEERKITITKFVEDTRMNGRTMQSLRENKGVNTLTICRICNHLNCKVEDIMEYVGWEGEIVVRRKSVPKESET